MFYSYIPNLAQLHDEAILREAHVSGLLRQAAVARSTFGGSILCAVGDTLIRAGQKLKNYQPASGTQAQSTC